MKNRSGKPPRILVVEDDQVVREQLAGALADEGYEVEAVATIQEGTERLARGDLSLVITDLKLPDGSGLEMVEKTRGRCPICQVLVVTAFASVDTAVEAMRRGAFHYLPKPLALDTLLVEVEKALEHAAVLRESQGLRRQLSSARGLGLLLGNSPQLANLREMIRQVAATDSTVLITGETGTGKELVANALHYESHRAGGPFIKVNCAALSENLLESELFGHEKGAFTGALKRRHGRFERADGGTLFLDEISEMGLHVQAKLLRVLQGDPFERVGGDEPVSADARLVAATNRVPEEAVEDGKLRQDLFYRLNIVRLEVPPLRERRQDILPLAEHFLALYAEQAGKKIGGLAESVRDVLVGYDWPGNVRELENSVHRAVVLARSDLLEQGDLPPPLSGAEPQPLLAASVEAAGSAADSPGPAAPASLNLQEVERQTIVRALDETGWSKAAAARKLGIFPSSLYKKMKRFGLPIQREDQ